MSEVKMLPLPEDAVEWLRQYGVANTAFQMEVIEGWFQAHARAVAEHNVAARDAEIEALRDLCGAAYQLAGVHDAPEAWLDALSDAAEGRPFSAEGLLPYMPDAVCEAEARAERLAGALQMIAGIIPCPDNLMGNVDIAIAALRDYGQEGKDGQN